MENVLITGRFDYLSAAHIDLFELAAKFGTVTIGLYGDSISGSGHVCLNNRAKVLRSCRLVDNVLVVHRDDPARLIFSLQPEYYASEDGIATESVKDALLMVGCEQLLIKREPMAPLESVDVLSWLL